MNVARVAYGGEILAAARHHGVDPRLLAAVAAQETGGPGADSGRNVVGDGGHGHGLFQIDDRWHAFAASRAAMDPAANADYAAGLLRSLLDHYGGDVHAALSAYNAGSPNAVGTRTDWGDGRPVGYADSVLRHYARLAPSPPPTSRDAQIADAAANRSSVDALRTLAPQLLAQAAAPAPVSSAPASAKPAPPQADGTTSIVATDDDAA